MNIFEKIEHALISPPPPAKTPQELASYAICELALPRVKNAMGGRFTEAQKLFATCNKIGRAINFELTEVAAHTAFQKQMAAHDLLAATGELAGVERGRSLAAWVVDFEARRDAAGIAATKAGERLLPLRIEISEIILTTLREEIADLEASEATQAARYGLSFRVTPTAVFLHGITDYLNSRGPIIILESN